jgi:hypothetical protein
VVAGGVEAFFQAFGGQVSGHDALRLGEEAGGADQGADGLHVLGEDLVAEDVGGGHGTVSGDRAGRAAARTRAIMSR